MPLDTEVVRKRFPVWKSGAFVVLTLALGCGSQSLPSASTSHAINGGTVTTLHPEVGDLFMSAAPADPEAGWCTASLVGTHYAITASHCFNFSDMPSPQMFLRLTDSSGVDHDYNADRVHVFTGRGDPTWSPIPDMDPVSVNDLALVHLTTDVPPTVATPASMATAGPNSGDLATIMGYGCDDTNGYLYGRRYHTYTFGTDGGVACFGDSGGPSFFGDINGNGAIWGTTYGPEASNGNDLVGSVPWFNGQLVELMSRWDKTDLEVGFERLGVELQTVSSPSPLNCKALCVATPACRAFSFDSAIDICHLKSAATGLVPCPACTSGVHVTAEYGFDRPGGDSRTVIVANPELCLAACTTDGGCVAWSFNPTTSGCTLKSSTSGAVANAGMIAGVDRSLEADVNRSGKTYGTSYAISPKGCRDFCAADRYCRAFSFHPDPNGLDGSGFCELKSGAPTPVTTPGWTSGLKQGLDVDSLLQGTLINDYAIDEGAPEVCQASCASNGSCRSWTFVPGGYVTNTPRCRLWSDATPAIARPAYVSGYKGNEMMPSVRSPACAGLACGPDGSGGLCGTCPNGQSCSAGVCQPIAACASKPCGNDGLGGICGICGGEQVCASGQCCTPNCNGKSCGSDGCGGTCGPGCSDTNVCLASGACCAPIPFSTACSGHCGYVSNGCGGTINCGACSCTPSCVGKKCGASDGCGRTCPGACTSRLASCQQDSGRWLCEPAGGL